MKKVLVSLAVLLFVAYGLNSFALDPAHKNLAIKNPKGDYIGTVNKMLLDPLGNIAFVTLSLSEEKGGKEIIVPLPLLSANEKREIVLNLSEKEIAEAPEFDRSRLSDATYGESVYRHYGMTPPWSEGPFEAPPKPQRESL